MARRVRTYDHAHYYSWYNLDVKLEKVELYKTIRKFAYQKNKRPLIFDIGCGQGFLTNYLKAVGFDVNEYVIKLAKKRYPKSKFFKVNANGINLQKYNLKKADVIICLNLIEHMSDKDRALFMEKTIPRLLKRNGLIIFSLYRQYHPLNVLNMLIQRRAAFDPTHYYNWTARQFIDHVKNYYKITKSMNLAGYTKLIPLTKYVKSETLIIAKLKK